MSLANYLSKTESFQFDHIEAKSISSKIVLSPLLLRGVGIDGENNASITGLFKLETKYINGNDKVNAIEINNGVVNFMNTPSVMGEKLVTERRVLELENVVNRLVNYIIEIDKGMVVEKRNENGDLEYVRF